MTEASLAVGFEQIGLAQLICYTLTSNRPSQRVMEKVGFRFDRPIIHGSLQRPHILYRLTASEWQEQQATSTNKAV